MTTLLKQQTRRRRGYTLVEMMVAVGVMSLVTVGTLRFGIQALNVYFFDSGRLMVNKDMRTFTNSLATDAVASNYFRIYPDFQTRSAPVTDGNSGDFLVLVFTDSNPANGTYFITQLVGYYRDPVDTTDPASLGPVRRFDTGLPGTAHAISVADQTKSLPDLLTLYAPTSAAHSNPIVVQLAQGLADGNLFYDYYDRSIMIRGQIVERGNQVRSAINTYNFTVSPRG
jgi:prepilin-type N-terminal cleavage/methylation domain-containing protein